MKNEFFFLVIPPNQKKNSNRQKAFHLLAAFLILCYVAIYFMYEAFSWTEFLAYAPMGIAIIYYVYKKDNELENFSVNLVLRLVELLLLFVALSFFYENKLLLFLFIYAFFTISLVFITWIEYKLLSDQFIHITHEKILIPNIFGNKNVGIKDIKNIALKWKVLTIELKNNQFVQKDVFHQYDENELALFEDFIQRNFR